MVNKVYTLVVLCTFCLACDGSGLSADAGPAPAPDAAPTTTPDAAGPAQGDANDSPDAAPEPQDGPTEQGNEPPRNPFLADSAWPMAHRNPYNQASSPLPAPSAAENMVVEDIGGFAGAITLAYGPASDDGEQLVWAKSLLSTFRFDIGDQPLRSIDRSASGNGSGVGLSGAYTLVDRDGTFFAPSGTSILAYRPDKSLGEMEEYELPTSAFASDDDYLVGFNILYDGMLVFATQQGMVGVLSRDFTELHTLSLGDEEISNSIATDEELGIYVVTSKRMVRVAWTGTALSMTKADGAWSANYEVGPENPAAGRVGAGSGSTPTLMGTGNQDKFVVITDGQELMHLVLFWRGSIPDDWQPIAPGKDRRIAAEVPIRFGDPDATTSVSEQSVLVRGYGALVVNNDYNLDLPAWAPTIFNRAAIAATNLPGVAPFGVEKFEWDPNTRTLKSVWANRDISCPNGIPTMSEASGLAYCVGQRDAVWTIEGMSWATGASVMHVSLGARPRFNSAYAATEIGARGDIVSGTLTGAVRVRPGPDAEPRDAVLP